jgi:hypothetical protein
MLKIKIIIIINIMHTKFRNKTNRQTAAAITATTNKETSKTKQNKAKHWLPVSQGAGGALVLLAEHEEDEVRVGHPGLVEAAQLSVGEHLRAYLEYPVATIITTTIIIIILIMKPK